MDPSLLAQQPTGFMGWFAQYGQVLYIMVNLAYWIGTLILLGYAVWQFKRWVNFQLGTGRSGALRTDNGSSNETDDAKAEKKPSVEEFVD